MKNIKLLSASVLVATLFSASASLASADTTKSSVELTEDIGPGASLVLPTVPDNLGTDLPDSIYKTGTKPDVTDSSILTAKDLTNPAYPNEVIPGYAGDLHFSLIPKQFDFGSHKVSAADQQVGVKYAQESASPFTGLQAVEVHDGRVSAGDDWHVTAKLGTFANLRGAKITFKNTQVGNQYSNGTAVLGKGHTGTTTKTFELVEGAAAKSFLSAGTVSKGNTSGYWANKTDLELSIPAGQLKAGKHTADVTWTLEATPEV
ncbi:hypothetical protein RyT2_25050 [Pseudolactococcus yaeyamensis]